MKKLNTEVGRILQLAEVREQHGTVGVEPVTMTPAEFARFVREEISTYQRIVKEANIQQQQRRDRCGFGPVCGASYDYPCPSSLWTRERSERRKG